MAFLNDDNLKRISYPFYPRHIWARWNKSGGWHTIIPIGVHELEIKVVNDIVTKNKGVRKIELYIYKKPDYYREDDAEKTSYGYITLTHVLNNRPTGRLGEEWYKHFSMCLDSKDLDMMSNWKGKKFKAVIAHHQRPVEYLENGKWKIKKDLLGENIYYWQPIIKSVHKLTDNVEVVNILDLFRAIKYDPMVDDRAIMNERLVGTNLTMVTGSEKIDEPPPF